MLNFFLSVGKPIDVIGSQGKYKISEFGVVTDSKNKVVPTTKNAAGDIVLNITSWDGLRDYRVLDLLAVHFKALSIPECEYNRVEAFLLDGDKLNIHARNVGYRFKNGPIKSDFVHDDEEYYYVPFYPYLLLAESGKCFNLLNNSFINWKQTKGVINKNIKGGYSTSGLCVPKYKNIAISLHRLLGFTFLEYPDHIKTLVINHKDGEPSNNAIDNLEWVTRGENNLHSYTHDLKSQHKRVLVRDVLSGEVREYYSIAECGRQLGYGGEVDTILFRLNKCAFSQVFQDGKQFKLKSDTRDWIIPDDPVQAIKDAQLKTRVIARNCLNLEVKEYESATSASKDTGVKVGTILFRLGKASPEIRNKPVFGYQFKYADDPKPFPDFTEQEYKDSLLPINRKVECRNLATGKEKIFNSVNECKKRLPGATGELNSYLLSGRQYLTQTGWQIKYLEDQWQEIPDYQDRILLNTREIMAKNEETGEIVIASNATEMSKILKRDPKAIRAAALARGHLLYHGYRFRLGFSTQPWPTTQEKLKKPKGALTRDYIRPQ